MLEGTIPSEIGLLVMLSFLSLEDNLLIGKFDLTPFQVANIKHLAIGSNKFSVNISEIQQLTTLTSLDLDGFDLSGTFPKQVLSLSLISLSLKNCRISGTIPTEIGLMTDLEYLFLGNNSFVGQFPLELANLAYLASLNELGIEFNNLTGTLPSFPSDLKLTCANSGIVNDKRCPFVIYDRGDYVSDLVFLIITILSSFVAFLILLASIFFILQRNSALVKISGLAYNLITLFGSFCIVLFLIPYGLTMNASQIIRDRSCRATSLILVCGLTAVFGTISVKQYPIWRALNPYETVRRPKSKIIPSVIGLMIVELALTSVIAAYVSGGEYSSGCDYSKLPSQILPIIFVIIGALFAFSAYSSWSIRQVSFTDSYNDATQMLIACCNIGLFTVAMIILAVLADRTETLFLSVSFTVILGVFSFFGFAHVTKIYQIIYKQGQLIPDEPEPKGTNSISL
eukprot:c21374_g4_i1.p1 GENE.c21374_g4_i1~~c21374_g4_i1.p1  ORF type:complete len:469 (+),score=97.39 c21374_g4_i1:43-1407(+)